MRSQAGWIGLVLVLAAAILWWPAPLRPSEAASVRPAPDRLPRQIVVRYGSPQGPSGVQRGTEYRIPDSVLATVQAQIRGYIPQLGVWLLQVAAGDEESALSELRRQPGVQYAESNYHASALETPNDTEWSKQWAPTKINAPQAWDIAHCQGVVIAILDTGTYLQHPDLVNTVWTNEDEVPANGIDDDGNGKIDDIHGWHFYQNCTTGVCEPYENPIIDDENGHGTHVTGIAAAETNNAAGVAGVSWGARAMIVRVLDQYGDGYYYDIAAGIVYAADNGARVINLSLGGESFSQMLQDAVHYAYGKGALVVAAAGNNGGAVMYPAACENAVAVAATDANDQRPSFSNQGPEVDIAAPGESIISTWPPPYLYYYKRGTSMAAPHVSAAAALLWSWRPDWSNAQVQDRLQSQADDVNSDVYPGHDIYLGWGRLNLYRALAGLPPGPTPTATITPEVTATPETTTTATPESTATATPEPTATTTPEPTATSTPPPPVYDIYVPLGWPVREGELPPSP